MPYQYNKSAVSPQPYGDSPRSFFWCLDTGPTKPDGHRKQIGVITDGDEVQIQVDHPFTDPRTNQVHHSLILKSINQFSLEKLLEYYAPLFQHAPSMKMFRHGNPWTDQEVLDWINLALESWKVEGKRQGCGVFAIMTEDGKFVGTLNSYFRKDGIGDKTPGCPTVEYGYIMAPWARDKGIATTAMSAVIEHVHQQYTFPLVKLQAATAHPGNPASMKVLRRTLGHQLPGTTNYGSTQPRVIFARSNESNERKPLVAKL